MLLGNRDMLRFSLVGDCRPLVSSQRTSTIDKISGDVRRCIIRQKEYSQNSDFPRRDYLFIYLFLFAIEHCSTRKCFRRSNVALLLVMLRFLSRRKNKSEKGTNSSNRNASQPLQPVKPNKNVIV